MFKSALAKQGENPYMLWVRGGRGRVGYGKELTVRRHQSQSGTSRADLAFRHCWCAERSEDVTEALVPGRGWVTPEYNGKINNLLAAIAQLSSGEAASANATGVAPGAVFMRPAMAATWVRLAAVAGVASVAGMALRAP